MFVAPTVSSIDMSLYIKDSQLMLAEQMKNWMNAQMDGPYVGVFK